MTREDDISDIIFILKNVILKIIISLEKFYVVVNLMQLST